VLRFGDGVEIDSVETQAHEEARGLARSRGFRLHAGVAGVAILVPAQTVAGIEFTSASTANNDTATACSGWTPM